MGTLSWLQSFLASAFDQVAVLKIRLNVYLHIYLLALPNAYKCLPAYICVHAHVCLTKCISA